jgi:hypothetical protein
MFATRLFGYGLISLSAILLAHHWQQWRELVLGPRRSVCDTLFFRRQIERRSIASALIGVVGAAMTLVDRVPRTVGALTGYLFGLLLGGLVILAIAISDIRANRRRRDGLQLELLAEELRKHAQALDQSRRE